jgi:hypothetical protein
VQGIVSDRSQRVIHVVRVLDDILDLPEIHEIIDRMCARVLARHGERTTPARALLATGSGFDPLLTGL